MTKRRISREIALKFLYQYDTIKETDSVDKTVNEMLEGFWGSNDESIKGDDREFTVQLIKGACENIEGVDAVIHRVSVNWRISRMPVIDRNIMRIAVYEIAYLRTIPPPVTINEAVELAKKYGSEDSGSFVNGILDKVRLAVEEGDLVYDPRSDS